MSVSKKASRWFEIIFLAVNFSVAKEHVLKILRKHDRALARSEEVRRMYVEPTVLWKHDRVCVHLCMHARTCHNFTDPALYSFSLQLCGCNSKIDFLTNAKEWENGLKTDYYLFPQLPGERAVSYFVYCIWYPCCEQTMWSLFQLQSGCKTCDLHL